MLNTIAYRMNCFASPRARTLSFGTVARRHLCETKSLITHFRHLTAKDSARAYKLMRSAVVGGTSAFYTPEQQEAWAPPEPSADWFAEIDNSIALAAFSFWRLRGYFVIRVDPEHEGFIDYAYLAPEAMGTGLGQKLYDGCEAAARARGFDTMSTEASHLARRFFLKNGWQDHGIQSVCRGRISVENFKMSKVL